MKVFVLLILTAVLLAAPAVEGQTLPSASAGSQEAPSPPRAPPPPPVPRRPLPGHVRVPGSTTSSTGRINSRETTGMGNTGWVWSFGNKGSVPH